MSTLENLIAFDPESFVEGQVIIDIKPIRLLKSNLLEKFTHITPEIVL